MAAEGTDARIALRWSRHGTILLAVMTALVGTTWLALALYQIGNGRFVRGLLLGGVSLPVVWIVYRAVQTLLAPPPTFVLHASGDIELRHPVLVESLIVDSADVHSLWLGPFERLPPTKRQWLIGPRPFLGNELDVSDLNRRRNDGPDLVVIAFARKLRFETRPRIPRAIYVLLRESAPSVLSRRTVHGLVGTVEDRAGARIAIERDGRTAATMPADVRAWLR